MRSKKITEKTTRRRSVRARAGFTLMEAMVVVAIVSVTAALAAPALGRAMAQRRASEATHALVRLGVRARSEAMGWGRAHLLRYSNFSAGGTLGRVHLWRGTVDRCSQNDWPTIMTGTCAGSGNCIDALDMVDYDFPTQDVQLRLPGAGWADLCFEPNGEMLFSNGGGPFGSTGPAAAPSPNDREGVQFRFRRLESGAQTGVDRFVVFPFGSSPRIVR